MIDKGEVVAITIRLPLPCNATAAQVAEWVEAELGLAWVDDPADDNPLCRHMTPAPTHDTIVERTGQRFERETFELENGRQRVVERVVPR